MQLIDDNRHEIERGRILQILCVRFPDAMPFNSLFAEVVAQGEIVSERSMRVHVGYLQGKGYVALEKLRAGRSEIEMQTVRLTARGLDLVDRRLDPDPGVKF